MAGRISGQWQVFTFILILSLSGLAFAQDFQAGLNYLSISQNTDGTWGSSARTDYRDTSTVLGAFRHFGRTDSTYSRGVNGLLSLSANNNDSRARKLGTQVAASLNADTTLNELLAFQNPEILNPLIPGFPGRGWGVAPGFGTSTIDTAIVLRALGVAGKTPGLTIIEETVAASQSSPQHPFQLPAGSTNFFLKVREVSGLARFILTLPDSSSIFADVDVTDTPLNIGPLPLTSGQWKLLVENLTGNAITYSAEVGFTDANSFDAFELTTAFSYLGMAQNTDGGWGIIQGEDSHLMITAEVLRTLATSNVFIGPSALSSGTQWLLQHQNPDGGFSSVPNASNVNESTLAMLAVGLADQSQSLSSVAGFLTNLQMSDGSWNGDPYLTASAMQALSLLDTVTAPEITTNGGGGIGANFVTDLSEIVISGRLALGIVDVLVNVPNAFVEIDTSNGTFRITLSLNEGLNQIVLTSIDGFGRLANQTGIDITRDSTLSGQEILVEEGLNVIGLRLDPANPVGAIGLLEMLGPQAIQVERLDASSGIYEKVARNGSGFVGADFPLAGLDGLLIRCESDHSANSTLAFSSTCPLNTRLVGRFRQNPQIDLVKGMNVITVPDPPVAIGPPNHPPNSAFTAFELLQAIGTEPIVSAVQRLDGVTGRFETAVYRNGTVVGTPFPIEPGIGYFVSMHTDYPGFVVPQGVFVSVQISSPANGSTVNGSPIVVSGTVSGEQPISVDVNGIPALVSGFDFDATVPLNPGANIINVVATDNAGRTGSSSISVTLNAIDFVIPSGGTVSSTRTFTADSSVLDQAISYSQTVHNQPVGVNYRTPSLQRISPTEVEVTFEIEATASSIPGIYQFQVEYELFDSNSNPVGPLTGNIFDFRIEVTP